MARKWVKSLSKRPSKLNSFDEGFEDLGYYQGEYKDGRRNGHGVYSYKNGDIYDGEWRKGHKEGYGKYVFADGKKNVGWFYKDRYVGKEPNEEMKRKMNKETKSSNDAKPLQRSEDTASSTSVDNDSSQSEDDNKDKKSGMYQQFYQTCKNVREKRKTSYRNKR